ncbi:hypothetical protein C7B76_06740 [filamentous cyanobacterium CCP2]|nr:hypothetical protein C7B76_06740 [filamentous cyanobacterium CCP2]
MSSIRIEAESMTLAGYVVEGNKYFASGNAIVGISSTDTAGSISTLFAGASGVYDLVVGYYDESDGESQLTLLIDGVAVESWILDQKLGSSNAAASTFVTRQISGVTLNANSVIEIRGTVQKGERARLDFIDIIPAGAVEPDTTAPTATITANNTTLAANSTQPYTFTVTYSDNVAINIDSIDNFDVRVTGPNGFSQLATLVSVSNSGNGSPRTATYQILPPGGSWDAVEAGTYTATIEPNQVSDTSGNLVPPGGAVNFSVIVQDLPPASEGAIRVEAESMTLIGYEILSGKSFASDGSWIRLTNSIGTATTTFTGGAGVYDIFVAYFDQNKGESQLAVSQNGSQIDSWLLNQDLGIVAAGEKSFTIRTIRGVTLNPQDLIQIQGTQNRREEAQVDYIEFRIDRTAPTASLIAESSVKGVGSNEVHTFNVRYVDEFSIDVSSLGSGNIRVIGPNGFNQLATLVSGNQNVDVFDWSIPYKSVTYSITPPPGGWNLSNSGTYSVVVENNQVTDQSGNFVAGQTIGSFQVNVLPTTFSGTNADEVIEGNTLNNTLNGGSGNDTLQGRGGNNLLNGGDGIDTANYSQSTRGVIANLATGQTTSAIFGTLAQPKIMPLGDSITAGEHKTEPVPGSYRIRLWERFQTEGLNIDFVGSQSNGPAALGDKDHEGYPGRTIEAIRGIITRNNTLETYQPDVITLMIGANDTDSIRLERLDEMLADLGNLIDTIAVRAPQTQLVVGSITPVTPALRGTYRNQLTQDYNYRLSSFVEGKAAQGKKVSFADIGRKISISDMNSDGLHPTAAGYDKLGDAWFDALVQKDTLVSIENLTGSAYDDSLIGNAGVNVLNGGAGNDTLRGGAGNDTLIGGTGNDVFVLASGEGNNFITDFQSGSDRLGLANNLAFSQLTITDGAGADAGNTLIQLTSTSELLATLQGVSANTVGSSAFITV